MAVQTVCMAAGNVVNLAEAGGVGDGKSDCTKALQRAIDDCSAKGGGIVQIPKGTYAITPVFMKNNVTLQLDEGACLLGPGSFDKYPQIKYPNKVKPSLISGAGLINIGIVGAGVIDGNTPQLAKGSGYQPRQVVLIECSNVRIEGISIVNSPNFHISLGGCSNVVMERVTIKARPNIPNAAGLGLSGWNLHLTHCRFETGDDNIALGSSTFSTGDVLIENCYFGVGHGLSAGTVFRPGINGVTIRNCTFEGTTAGLRLKNARGKGGVCENVVLSNVTMKAVSHPISINSYYGKKLNDLDPRDKSQPVSDTTPAYRNIQITDLKVEGGAIAALIAGLPEMPVSNVVFRNCRFTSDTGMRLMNVKGLQFFDTTIQAKEGAALLTVQAEMTGAEKFTTAPFPLPRGSSAEGAKQDVLVHPGNQGK
jgi:polygalacturonase